MSDFTLLTKEQCDRSEILKIRGEHAILTDFSIILGAYITSIDIKKSNSGSIFSTKNVGNSEVGNYWTRTKGKFNKNMVLIIGDYYEDYITERNGGARIILPFSSSDAIPYNSFNNLVTADDGILEVEYGYYPQDAASKDMQEKLESEFDSGKAIETINSYTTDSKRNNDEKEIFEPKKYQEYEYDGKMYVRTNANFNYNRAY